MPNSPSAIKRLKQSQKRRLHNRIAKKLIKTYTKRTMAAVAAKEFDKADGRPPGDDLQDRQGRRPPGPPPEHRRPAQEQAAAATTPAGPGQGSRPRPESGVSREQAVPKLAEAIPPDPRRGRRGRIGQPAAESRHVPAVVAALPRAVGRRTGGRRRPSTRSASRAGSTRGAGRGRPVAVAGRLREAGAKGAGEARAGALGGSRGGRPRRSRRPLDRRALDGSPPRRGSARSRVSARDGRRDPARRARARGVSASIGATYRVLVRHGWLDA